MSNDRPYQVRIFLKEEFAAAAKWPGAELASELKPLSDILKRHNAEIDHNQFDEFSSFVKHALDNWDDMQFPSDDVKEQFRKLAILTATSLMTEEKRPFFKREFTLKVNGQTMLTGEQGDALIDDLKALGTETILTDGRAFVPGKDYDVPAVRKSYIPARHPGT